MQIVLQCALWAPCCIFVVVVFSADWNRCKTKAINTKAADHLKVSISSHCTIRLGALLLFHRFFRLFFVPNEKAIKAIKDLKFTLRQYKFIFIIVTNIIWMFFRPNVLNMMMVPVCRAACEQVFFPSSNIWLFWGLLNSLWNLTQSNILIMTDGCQSFKILRDAPH